MSKQEVKVEQSAGVGRPREFAASELAAKLAKGQPVASIAADLGVTRQAIYARMKRDRIDEHGNEVAHGERPAEQGGE